jgi:hypothetical protein
VGPDIYMPLSTSDLGTFDILRETQISNFLKILQILDGYMQRIPIFHLVSNWMPAKCGLAKIKRANPLAQTRPSEF